MRPQNVSHLLDDCSVWPTEQLKGSCLTVCELLAMIMTPESSGSDNSINQNAIAD